MQNSADYYGGMPPFPFAFLTWRECIVGVQPTEMCYMQVEKNWVTFNPRGEPQGNGYATGRNLGYVKWRMREDTFGGRPVRVLRSESFDRKTEETCVEEVGVDSRTNGIVFQNEERSVHGRGLRTQSLFFPDRIEVSRSLPGGGWKTATLIPDEGMDAVQRRFSPLGKSPKDFLILDGIAGTFHRVHAEVAGRFEGNWGPDYYRGVAYRFDCEGRSHTVMLTKEAEIVKIEFSKDITLALMSQPRSKRSEERSNRTLNPR